LIHQKILSLEHAVDKKTNRKNILFFLLLSYINWQQL